MRLKSRILTGLAAAALLSVAACGGGGERPDSQLRRGIGADPDSVDPHQSEGTWANDVIGDMFIGLFTEAPDASPVPGVVDSWSVTEDGLVWTFKLKETLW